MNSFGKSLEELFSMPIAELEQFIESHQLEHGITLPNGAVLFEVTQTDEKVRFVRDEPGPEMAELPTLAA